jgi:hypothetical protein
MTRHLNDIKDLLFEQPDFDDEQLHEDAESSYKKKKNDKSIVETIVFRDPAKKRRSLPVGFRSSN